MANDNAKNLLNQYESLIKDNDPSLLNQFCTIIQNEWTVSINMRPNILIRFFVSGKYKNVHESRGDMIKELARANGILVPQEIADGVRLKKWHNARELFENSINNGKKFKYGALNIGGVGTEKYGDFCIVFDRDYFGFSLTIVFIKEDSLKYVDDSRIDEERLRKDIADMNHVQYLATLKHKNDIDKDNRSYPYIVCNDRTYMESIIQDELSINSIESVRISKKRYDSYYSYLYNYLTSNISVLEKYQLDEFWNIVQFLSKNEIRLEVADGN